MINASNYSVTEFLKCGAPFHVRSIRPDDKDKLLSAFQHLDQEAIYTRFFSFKKTLSSSELTQATEVDFKDTVALVAAAYKGDREILIGGGRYAGCERRDSTRIAELAFLISQSYRAQGIASSLLGHLVRIGQENGVARFEADVLAHNHAMLAVFNRSGLRASMRQDGGVVHVTLWLDPPAPS
jgi:RimJ/RimL family protein N-acetyltransferase